jgi:hypothetical protein
MKKYKLIKEYPQSPPLNTILDERPLGGYYTHKDGWWVLDYEVEQHPEFWQELVEKEYKILKFRNRITGGTRETSTWYPDAPDNWEIYQIKRISDGEIFTIGDVVNIGLGSRRIARFDVTNDYLIIVHEKGVITSEYFQDMEHVEKPLFTTEDGVDIYEKDVVYIVDTAHNILISANKAKADWNCNKTYIYFKYKENAEKWIEDNKPKYSKRDIERGLYESAVTPYGSQFYIHLESFWRGLNENK